MSRQQASTSIPDQGKSDDHQNAFENDINSMMKETIRVIMYPLKSN